MCNFCIHNSNKGYFGMSKWTSIDNYKARSMRTMLWSDFDACRRSLRLEWGGKFFCMWVLPIVNTYILSSVGNTSNQTTSNSSSRVTYHLVIELGTPLKSAYGRQIWNSNDHIYTHTHTFVYIQICMYVCII